MIMSARKRAKARSLARKRDWSGAIDAYKTLGSEARLDVRTLVQLGHAYKEDGQAEQALRVYHEAASRVPFSLDAQLQVALFQQSRSNMEDATTFFARALVLSPEAEDLQTHLSELGHTTESARDKAILTATLYVPSTMTAPIATRFNPRARLHRARARKAGRRRDWPGAEQHYAAALTVCPDDPALLMQIGHSQIEQGRTAEALASYRRAALAAPGDFEKYYHAGNALRLLGRAQSALAAYEASSRLNANFSPSTEEIARLHASGVVGSEAVGGTVESPDPNAAHRQAPKIRYVQINRDQLTEEAWLSDPQKTIFKYFSGALAFKD